MAAKSVKSKFPKMKVKITKATRHVPKRVIAKVNRKRPASGFELAVHKILGEEKIRFVKEKTIGQIHVDVLIGAKEVVEAQGCYFHGHPNCQKSLSEMQLKAQASDARRFAFLKRLGYTVHEIWECDFYKDPEKYRALFRRIAGR